MTGVQTCALPILPLFVSLSASLCLSLCLSLSLSQPDESLEKVIEDTECLFKSREKEYQDTIDQIEVREESRE